MLLLFARSGLYRDRAQRPGLHAVIASLFQVTLVVLIYAVIEGDPFPSYYIFYGSLFFALLYVSFLRWVFERVSGGAARGRLPPPGRAGGLGGEHRGRRARAARLSEIEPFGFVSRSGSRGSTACATSARWSSSSATSTRSTRC